jgi:hypothetical protein
MKLEELERYILLEANKGDIAEGLFSLGLSLLLADPSGELFKKEFDKYRKKLDPDKSSVTTIYKAPYTNKNGVTDLLEVELRLNLKSPKTCAIAFGGGCADFENLPSSIQKKIGTIERELLSTPSVKALLKSRDEFLQNNTEEYVKIVVDADGVAGEQSGGTLKGDVAATISVGAGSLKDAQAGNIKLTTQDASSVGWSLKADSKTVGNLSVLDGLAELASLIGLPKFLKAVPKFKSEISGKGKRINYDFIKKVTHSFVNEFWRTPDGPELTKKLYKYLKAQTYGEDAVDIIDISDNKLKVIAKDAVDMIEKEDGIIETGKVIDDNGMPLLLFYHKPKNRPADLNDDLIFQLRIKWERGRDESHPDVLSGKKKQKTPVFKLMVELGPLARNPELLKRNLDAQEQNESLTNTKITYKMLEQMVEEAIKKAR